MHEYPLNAHTCLQPDAVREFHHLRVSLAFAQASLQAYQSLAPPSGGRSGAPPRQSLPVSVHCSTDNSWVLTAPPPPPSSAVPSADPGRANLLASIQGAGVHSLKKVRLKLSAAIAKFSVAFLHSPKTHLAEEARCQWQQEQQVGWQLEQVQQPHRLQHHKATLLLHSLLHSANVKAPWQILTKSLMRRMMRIGSSV